MNYEHVKHYVIKIAIKNIKYKYFTLFIAGKINYLVTYA